MSGPVTEGEIRDAYRATIEPLYRFVSRRCDGDRELAEDVTQEAWLRAVKTWHANGMPDVPLAWLTTVARNLLANHFRRQPAEPLDDEIALGIVDGPDRSAERESLVARAMARLPAMQVRLLDAFHFKRQGVAAIAIEHGLSERAVEGRLRRARLQLRRQIETDPDIEGDEK